MLSSGITVQTRQYARCLRNIVHQDSLQNICLQVISSAFSKKYNAVLCMTLPRASRTAWEVKFSDGMRLMKCFCRLFSYTQHTESAPDVCEILRES